MQILISLLFSHKKSNNKVVGTKVFTMLLRQDQLQYLYTLLALG